MIAHRFRYRHEHVEIDEVVPIDMLPGRLLGTLPVEKASGGAHRAREFSRLQRSDFETQNRVCYSAVRKRQLRC